MSNAFDAIDYATPAGQQIKARLEDRLGQLRAKLEDQNLAERETQAVRGAIGEIKSLLRGPATPVFTPGYSNMDFNKRG